VTERVIARGRASEILERVEGPTMAADLLAHPERLDAHAATLARLHEELHRIEAPGGGSLLHLDLHPQNVLLAACGPVVIDWTNARAGRAEVDPALTWVILMASAGEPGRVLAAAFERHVDVRSGLHEAVAYRLADPNVTGDEAAAVRGLR
jgi:aminoglycoside phosphotransferase (APT) family kinase protein